MRWYVSHRPVRVLGLAREVRSHGLAGVTMADAHRAATAAGAAASDAWEKASPAIVPLAHAAQARAGALAVQAWEKASPAVPPLVEAGRERAESLASRAWEKTPASVRPLVEAGRERSEALATHAWEQAAPTIVPLAEAALDRSREAASMPPRMARRLRGPLLRATAVAVVAGAVVFYFDSVSGRRRRALARDRASRMGHMLGRVPKRIGRRGRFVRGVARGVAHGTPFVSNGRHATVDEETLVARVRSEIFRDAPVPAGMVNIDAYEGCVTLRGQLPNEGDMRRLVAATKRVEGVAEVRSYLHLPDELPPNKAEMYEHSEPHLPSL